MMPHPDGLFLRPPNPDDEDERRAAFDDELDLAALFEERVDFLSRRCDAARSTSTSTTAPVRRLRRRLPRGGARMSAQHTPPVALLDPLGHRQDLVLTPAATSPCSCARSTRPQIADLSSRTGRPGLIEACRVRRDPGGEAPSGPRRRALAVRRDRRRPGAAAARARDARRRPGVLGVGLRALGAPARRRRRPRRAGAVGRLRHPAGARRRPASSCGACRCGWSSSPAGPRTRASAAGTCTCWPTAGCSRRARGGQRAPGRAAGLRPRRGPRQADAPAGHRQPQGRIARALVPDRRV